jgi:geranylgeranyl diphosphate synthase type I
MRHRALIAEYLRSNSEFAFRSLSGSMSAYHMGWTDRAGHPTSEQQGKFVRPALCLWACEALGGIVTTALPAAGALEWIHNFTLVHDDIQDGDRERRGRETVWSIWGVGQGVNTGDAMFAHATMQLASLDGGGTQTVRVLRAVLSATLEVIEGQSQDLDMEGRLDVTPRTYLRMVRAKTGALLGASLEAGAILAEASDDDVRLFRQAGRLLGTAFQMRDDWLGFWGDPELTGKSRTSDANRHKMSYPVVAAHRVMSQLQRRRLREVFEADSAEAEPRLRELLEATGGPALTHDDPRRFAGKAVTTLARTRLSRESLEAFEAVADYVSTRSR